MNVLANGGQVSSIELTLLILIGCTAFCDANDTLDANIFTCVLSNICQLSPCQNGGNCTHVFSSFQLHL